MKPDNVEDALHHSMIATLHVISRCGSRICVDRAARLYLASFPPERRARIKALEDLSYRLLVETEHDPRVDAVYRLIIDRAHEMTGFAEAAIAPAE